MTLDSITLSPGVRRVRVGDPGVSARHGALLHRRDERRPQRHGRRIQGAALRRGHHRHQRGPRRSPQRRQLAPAGGPVKYLYKR